MKWYLYILESKKDGDRYVGISQDPLKRLKEHNTGKTFSTKKRKPFILIYTEEYETREQARKREVYLKSYSGAGEKQDIIEKSKKIGE